MDGAAEDAADARRWPRRWRWRWPKSGRFDEAVEWQQDAIDAAREASRGDLVRAAHREPRAVSEPGGRAARRGPTTIPCITRSRRRNECRAEPGRLRHGACVARRSACVAAARAAARRVGAAAAPRSFVDATAESGLDFTHVNGATGELLLPEVIGAGGALFDYDNDGDLDLFAVQGGALRPGRGRQRADAAKPPVSQRSAAGGRRLRFTDVTERSGIVATGYGMGAATGDIDNDGWVDLYVTDLGSNRMFRNNGDGTFTDVTAGSGTDDRALEHQRHVLRLRPRRLARSVRRQLRRLQRWT